jgi:chromosome partitioning protein
MQRIVVLNPKGGSGKTTIAINLASYFAAQGEATVLIDHDPQGSSTRWLKKRHPAQPPIHPIAAYAKDLRTTRTWQLRVPPGSERVVVDTPAALDARLLPDLTRDAAKILVPVLPSDIDTYAASRCIADLLLIAKVRRESSRIGVIANRVRRHTRAYQSLIRFLQTLGIPIVATIRDSQNYTRGAETGLGIHEMKRYVVREDMEQWEPLIAWLDGAPVEPLHTLDTDAEPAVGDDSDADLPDAGAPASRDPGTDPGSAFREVRRAG